MRPLAKETIQKRRLTLLALKDYFGEAKQKDINQALEALKHKQQPITDIIKHNLADKTYTQALLKSL